MKTVREILQNKGYTIWSISPDATVYSALQLMAEKEIGALLVMKDSELIGIMSERDYARKIVLQGKFSKDTIVQDIMSSKVIYVSPNLSTEECMALMINKRVRHLPVFEEHKLVGMISIGDVVKALIDEKEFMIDQLVHYIKGTPQVV